MVPTEQMDTTKAMLVSEGYPKSGFTYDVFKNIVNLMTTDSDRQTFKLYDLETRIGSTIQIFEGVKEASYDSPGKKLRSTHCLRILQMKRGAPGCCRL